MEFKTFDGKVVGSVFVDESGIHKVIDVGDYGEYICETIMPRAAFVEAYNKFILEEGESTSKPNCVDCDHFGKGCNKCEKNEDE